MSMDELDRPELVRLWWIGKNRKDIMLLQNDYIPNMVIMDKALFHEIYKGKEDMNLIFSTPSDDPLIMP